MDLTLVITTTQILKNINISLVKYVYNFTLAKLILSRNLENISSLTSNIVQMFFLISNTSPGSNPTAAQYIF